MNEKSGNQRLNKNEKRVRDSLSYLFEYQKLDQWESKYKDLKERYKGNHHKRQASRDRFTYNATFSSVNNMIPNLVLSNPKIRVKPLTPKYMKETEFGVEQHDNVKAAITFEAGLNYEYRRIKALKEHRKAIQDALFAGIGITKTGYSYQTISSDREEYVKEDQVFLQRISPMDFGFHPMATHPDDSPLLCHRLTQLKKSLKKAKDKYSNVDSLTPSLPKHLEEKLKDKSKSMADINLVQVWEVHDQENDMIYTFAGGNRILISKTERQYDHESSDFQVITFAKDNDEMLGIAYLGMVEDEQLAMNEVLTFMVNHIHMFPGQIIAEEGVMDEHQMAQISEGGQGAIQTVKDLSKVLKSPPVPMGSDYINLFSILQNNMDRTLGIPDFLRSAASSRKSASESAFIQGDVDIKRQYLGGLVKDFIIDGLDNMAALMQQFYDAKRYVPIEGELNPKFIEYSKEEIQGEYQFDFDIEELRASNQSEVQQIINALNVVAAHPLLATVLQTMDPLKLAKDIFKKMGMNLEQYQIREISEVTFVSPDKENLIALDPTNPIIKQFGGIMPQPKPGEDHPAHMLEHMKAIMELRDKTPTPENLKQLEELRRHIAIHQKLQQEKDAKASPATPLQQNQQTASAQSQGDPNRGPGGPVNLPGQSGINRLGADETDASV